MVIWGAIWGSILGLLWPDHDSDALRRAGGVARPRGHVPAASSRLASTPHHSPLKHVQLPDLS